MLRGIANATGIFMFGNRINRHPHSTTAKIFTPQMASEGPRQCRQVAGHGSRLAPFSSNARIVESEVLADPLVSLGVLAKGCSPWFTCLLEKRLPFSWCAISGRISAMSKRNATRQVVLRVVSRLGQAPEFVEDAELCCLKEKQQRRKATPSEAPLKLTHVQAMARFAVANTSAG